MLSQNQLATLLCFQLFRTAITAPKNTIISGWVGYPNGRGTFTVASSQHTEVKLRMAFVVTFPVTAQLRTIFISPERTAI